MNYAEREQNNGFNSAKPLGEWEWNIFAGGAQIYFSHFSSCMGIAAYSGTNSVVAIHMALLFQKNSDQIRFDFARDDIKAIFETSGVLSNSKIIAFGYLDLCWYGGQFFQYNHDGDKEYTEVQEITFSGTGYNPLVTFSGGDFKVTPYDKA